MRVTTPEISWHGRDPVYSVDLQPGKHTVQRLATAGVDKYVRIWKLLCDASDDRVDVEILSNLNRHTKSVNIVRFSPDGDTLASTGDDCVIIFWKLSESTSAPSLFQEEDDENKETWNVSKTLRGHLEDIYDLCWSADGRYLITGAVDNTAIIWDITKDCKLALLNEHKSFVQGVAFDPLSKYVATLSTDRSCRVFMATGTTCVNNISRLVLPTNQTADDANQNETKQKWCRMYHDDSMRSFFRRLSFSPDGELLVTPAGCVESGDEVSSVTYVFSRRNFSKPVLHLPSKHKVTIAVRFSPVLYELHENKKKPPQEADIDNLTPWEKYKTLFCLPYRMIFAVATEDSVILYDTQQSFPFAHISRIHYHQLCDLTWSSDGQTLVIASTDGYVSIVRFDPQELGVVYVSQVVATTELCLSGRRGKSVGGGVAHTTASEGEEKPSRTNVLDDDAEQVNQEFEMEVDSTSRVQLVIDSSSDSVSDANLTNEKSLGGNVDFNSIKTLNDKNNELRNENDPVGILEMDVDVPDTSGNVSESDDKVDNIAFKTNVVEIDSSKTQPVEPASVSANQPKRRIQLTTLSLLKPA